MYRFAIFVMFIVTAYGCIGQLQPRVRVLQQVADSNMVINDRGSQLEVLPKKRATPTISKETNRVVYQVATTDASAAVSPKQLGVVFNHATQLQGYVNGEIVFKLKDDLRLPSNFDVDSYPNLAKLTEPNVYLVVARSPIEFVQLVKRLQERSDVEWVEPMVVYGQLERRNN
jgi:hypothetical protein